MCVLGNEVQEIVQSTEKNEQRNQNKTMQEKKRILEDITGDLIHG